MPKTKEGFLKLYHETWNEIAHLKLSDIAFLLYLLHKQNQFGDKSFFLTDKCIMTDLRIPRMTLCRIKKRIKVLPFIQYKAGKYRKSVSEWYITGINMVHKAYQNGATSNMDSKMDKKKEVVSQPNIINNIIVNTPKRELSEDFLKTIHQDSQRLLNR